MAGADSLDRTGKQVSAAVFLALMVDGMDLQVLALALPAITQELGLSDVRAGALGTFTLAAMGVGGMLSGWLADRVGRVRVVWTAVLIFTLFTGLVALCDTYWQVAVTRGISGFGLGAVYSIGSLLATEYVPTRLRTTVLGTLQAGWAVGYVIAALLASYLLPRYGWRVLFAAAIPLGLVTLAMLRGIPDPPSFTRSASGAGTFAKMWADAACRRTFLLWTAAAIALQFGYYGANTWLPSYIVRDLGVDVQSMGWYVAGTYGMTVIGKILTGVLADRWGRRAVWVGAGLATAVYLPVLIYAATPGNIAPMLLVFGFLYAAPYAVNATYMSESFPAGVRATAMATSYALGRTGSTMSPLLIGMASSRYSIGAGIAMLGAAYAVCALVPGLFIREKMFDPKAVEAARPAHATG